MASSTEAETGRANSKCPPSPVTECAGTCAHSYVSLIGFVVCFSIPFVFVRDRERAHTNRPRVYIYCSSSIFHLDRERAHMQRLISHTHSLSHTDTHTHTHSLTHSHTHVFIQTDKTDRQTDRQIDRHRHRYTSHKRKRPPT